jgi:hypothetical protein
MPVRRRSGAALDVGMPSWRMMSTTALPDAAAAGAAVSWPYCAGAGRQGNRRARRCGGGPGATGGGDSRR